MAARLRKTHQEDVRTKIQVSQLLNVLQNHALGITEELPNSQLRAIEILLRKTLPDLSQISGDLKVDVNPITVLLQHVEGSALQPTDE